MSREAFLNGLNEIKLSRETSDDLPSLCNRLYMLVVECLAGESKNVEVKLEILTTLLQYYVKQRAACPSPSIQELDAFEHFLFMECSHVVLGMEFNQLDSSNPIKSSFKSVISDVRERLEGKTIGHLFSVLDWLMINQWSHPTLVAMMKGDDVDKDLALSYISSGEYPELLRLRIQMLTESGCESYACNLVSWCVQSSVFESDVALRSNFLSLLHKLNRTAQFHNEGSRLTCCMGKELLQYMLSSKTSADIDRDYLYLLSQTVLLNKWILPLNDHSCLKDMLQYYVSECRQTDGDSVRLLEDVHRLVSMAQGDVQKILLVLESLAHMANSQLLSYSSQLALSCLQQQQNESSAAERGCESSAEILLRVCAAVVRLYQQHPQMYLRDVIFEWPHTRDDASTPWLRLWMRKQHAFITVIVCRSGNVQFCALEAAFLQCSPLTEEPLAPPGVHPPLYASLLHAVNSLSPPSFSPYASWDIMRPQALLRLAETGYRYMPESNSLEEVGSRVNEGWLNKDKAELAGRVLLNGAVLNDGSVGIPGLYHVIKSFDNQPVMEQYLTCEAPHGVRQGPLTLDDIQQVLGVTHGLEQQSDGMDERVLNEITAYLQTELLREGATGPVVLPSSFSTQPGAIISTSVHEAMRVDPSSSSTLLVTDVNLPYLQQFLPNLQSVVKSVQSFVGAKSVVDDPLTCEGDGLGVKIEEQATTIRSSSATGVQYCGDSDENLSNDIGRKTALKRKLSADFISPHSSIPGQVAGETKADGLALKYRKADMSSEILSAEAISGANGKSTNSSAVSVNSSYYCRFCLEGFHSLDERRKHTKFTCSKKKNCVDTSFKCEVCEKLFVSRHGRTTHMNRMHGCTTGGACETNQSSHSGDVDDVGSVESWVGSTEESKKREQNDDDDDDDDDDLCDDNKCTNSSETGRISVKVEEDVKKLGMTRECFVRVGPVDEKLRDVSSDGEPREMCDRCGALVLSADLTHHGTTCVAQAQNKSSTSPDVNNRVNGDDSGRDSSSVELKNCSGSLLSSEFLTSNSGLVRNSSNQLQSVLLQNSFDSGAGTAAFTNSIVNQRLLNDVSAYGSGLALIGNSYVPVELDTNHMNSTAVLEMLQIADHFLRAGSCTQPGVTSQFQPQCSLDGGAMIEDDDDDSLSATDILNLLPPPPPYHLAVTASSLIGHPAIKFEPTLGGLAGEMGKGGREIQYEGTRMMEMIEYQCDACLLTFASNEEACGHVAFSDHARAGVASYHMYRCLDCGIKYRDKQVMRNHILYLCQAIQGASLGSQSCELEDENDGLHGCRICGKKFINASFLRVHEQTRHSAQEFSVQGAPALQLSHGDVVYRQALQSGDMHSDRSQVYNPSADVGDKKFNLPRVEHYPYMTDASLITKLHCESNQISAQPYPIQTPTVVTVPSIGELRAGLRRPQPVTSLSVGKQHEQSAVIGQSEGQRSWCKTLDQTRDSSSRAMDLPSSSLMASVVNCLLSTEMNSAQCGLSDADIKLQVNQLCQALVKPNSISAASVINNALQFNSACLPVGLGGGRVTGVGMEQVGVGRREMSYQPLADVPVSVHMLTSQPQLANMSLSSSSINQTSCGLPQLANNVALSSSSVTELTYCRQISESQQVASNATVNENQMNTVSQTVADGYRVGNNLLQSNTSSSSMSVTNRSQVINSVSATSDYSSITQGDNNIIEDTSDDKNYSLVESKAALSGGSKPLRGIYYKNVLMQCRATYYCAVCSKDISTRQAKLEHRQQECGDPSSVSYTRRYAYLCPYCSASFPSQKQCREHQIESCLCDVVGISADQMRSQVKELTCPLCPKKYFNLIPLKGHLTQVHKLAREESKEMLNKLGYVEEMFDQKMEQAYRQNSCGKKRSRKAATDDTKTRQIHSECATPDGSSLAESSRSSGAVYSVMSAPQSAGGVGEIISGCEGDMKGESLMITDSSGVPSTSSFTHLLSSSSSNLLDISSSSSNLLDISSSSCSRSLLTSSALSSSLSFTSLSSANSRTFINASNVESRLDSRVSSDVLLKENKTVVQSGLLVDEGKSLVEGCGVEGEGASAGDNWSDEDEGSQCDLTLGITDLQDPGSPPGQGQKRRPRGCNEFFIMMFRNYPILAKGISVCDLCQMQLPTSAEIESHASLCEKASGNVPSIRRSTVFKCMHCDATFWKAKDCRQHQIDYCLKGVNVESLTTPMIICPLCSARAYNRSGLVSHMKYKHNMNTACVRDCMKRHGIQKRNATTSINRLGNGLDNQKKDGLDSQKKDGLDTVKKDGFDIEKRVGLNASKIKPGDATNVERVDGRVSKRRRAAVSVRQNNITSSVVCDDTSKSSSSVTNQTSSYSLNRAQDSARDSLSSRLEANNGVMVAPCVTNGKQEVKASDESLMCDVPEVKYRLCETLKDENIKREASIGACIDQDKSSDQLTSGIAVIEPTNNISDVDSNGQNCDVTLDSKGVHESVSKSNNVDKCTAEIKSEETEIQKQVVDVDILNSVDIVNCTARNTDIATSSDTGTIEHKKAFNNFIKNTTSKSNDAIDSSLSKSVTVDNYKKLDKLRTITTNNTCKIVSASRLNENTQNSVSNVKLSVSCVDDLLPSESNIINSVSMTTSSINVNRSVNTSDVTVTASCDWSSVACSQPTPPASASDCSESSDVCVAETVRPARTRASRRLARDLHVTCK